MNFPKTLLASISTMSVLVVCCVVLNGCLFAVPLIQGFKDAGLTAGDRAQLLKTELRQFHHSIVDGRKARALAYADEEFRDDFKQVLRQYGRHEKVVSTEVDFVDFDEESYTATVETYVKYFNKSYYIVQERLVKEVWKYSHGDGWELVEYSVLDDNVEQG